MKNWKGKVIDVKYTKIFLQPLLEKKLKMNDHIEKISDLKKLLSKKNFPKDFINFWKKIFL